MRTLAVAVAVTALSLAGAAASVAAPASHGTVTGHTVIHWSGVKAITLDTDQQRLTMPAYDGGFHLASEGKFALATIVPREQPPAEECYWGYPMCVMYQAYRVAAYPVPSPGFIPDTPGTDETHLPVGGKPVDVYLFSDGPATLTLSPRNVPGRSEYTAAGSMVGGFEKLGAFCPTSGCDPVSGYGSSYMFGGASYDLGTLGYSAVLAYARMDDAGVVGNQHVRVCHYPNPGTRDAPANVADHPYGCDLAGDPQHAGDEGQIDPAHPDTPPALRGTVYSASQTADQVGVGTGALRLEAFGGQKGRSYVGFHAGSVGPAPARYGAYGIWFRYGVLG